MNSLDIFVQQYFSLIRTPLVTEWMIILTGFFDVAWRVVLVMACIALLVYLVRGLRYMMLFVVTLLGGSLAVYLLKVFFARARPLDMVIPAFGQSFPSYHATIATIFFGMLIYIFDSHLSRPWRIAFNTLCVGSILLIAFSRVYLGVHWVSDVLGGVVLGAFVVWISTQIFARAYRSRVSV